MRRFNSDGYTPESQVMTQDGRQARILMTNGLGEWPVVAQVISEDQSYDLIQRYSKVGKIYSDGTPDPLDLYFVEEGDELTEFERAVEAELTSSVHIDGIANIHDINEYIKKAAARILSAAKKEILQTSPILPADSIEVRSFQAGRKQGKDEAQKYLPRWKTHHGWGRRLNYGGFLVMNDPICFRFSKELHEGDVYLTEEDLKRLPKEE